MLASRPGFGQGALPDREGVVTDPEVSQEHLPLPSDLSGVPSLESILLSQCWELKAPTVRLSFCLSLTPEPVEEVSSFCSLSALL